MHIYLNDGNGNLYEDNSVYYSNEAPRIQPHIGLLLLILMVMVLMTYLLAQWGYSIGSRLANDFILPYPDLLLLSDSSGRFSDASANIDDQNNGNGKFVDLVMMLALETLIMMVITIFSHAIYC